MAGMELLFATAQSQIRNNGDAVVCAIHWNMVANNYKCIGVGEEVPASTDGAKRSEMLPARWSADPDTYGLLYLPNDSTDTHLLKVIRMDNTLLVHVMRSSDNKVADMSINMSDYTTEDLSSFDSAYKNLDDLSKKFKSEIVKHLSKEPAKAAAGPSQSDQHRRQADRERRDPDYDPLRVGPPRRGGRPTPGWADPNNPLAVGRGDLDPLAGGRGGGMLMDPRGFPGIGRDPDAGLPGRLPPGAVPPGARFDPFGPPDPDRSGGNPNPYGGNRAGPDPDHLPPPGFDDMFM